MFFTLQPTFFSFIVICEKIRELFLSLKTRKIEILVWFLLYVFFKDNFFFYMLNQEKTFFLGENVFHAWKLFLLFFRIFFFLVWKHAKPNILWENFFYPFLSSCVNPKQRKSGRRIFSHFSWDLFIFFYRRKFFCVLDQMEKKKAWQHIFCVLSGFVFSPRESFFI